MRSTSSRTTGVLCILLSVASHAPGPVSAEDDHCDADLGRPTTNPSGYRLRGDRCEGIYVQDVASTTLRLVSFTASFENFDPASEEHLRLEWTAWGNRATRLRAQPLRSKLYYRMDTLRPAGGTSYRWSPDFLATFDLRRENLGLLAWTSYRIGDRLQDVYLPLRLMQRSAPTPRPYSVMLMPGVEFDDVFMSLAPLEQNGSPGPPIVDQEPLQTGFYPAGRPIIVTLPELDARGLYRLDFGATLAQGGVSAASLWFYHPGE